MLHLKDIAARMGDVHPRTAKRWWRKLDREQSRAGKPSVCPDVRGHGPHKWKPETAERLISLYQNYYAARGTSPQIVRAKYNGDLQDERQFEFTFSKSLKCRQKRQK